MNHKGTFYGIMRNENGWVVSVGMRELCDGFDTKAEAITWIKSR